MNTANAFGFLALGLFMHVLPLIAPGAAVGSSGDAVGGLWLALMSVVVAGIGGAYLTREGYQQVLAGFARIAAAREARRVASARPAVRPLPLSGVRVNF